MTTYLLKTEPDEFGYDDLERGGVSAWDGVTNPAAQKCMRGMCEGDEAFIYHTGGERRIVGLARVVRGAYPDPANPGLLASGEPKSVLVDVAAMARAATPLTLAAMRAEARFEGFELLRQPRLSVMAVPRPMDTLIRRLTGLRSGG